MSEGQGGRRSGRPSPAEVQASFRRRLLFNLALGPLGIPALIGVVRTPRGGAPPGWAVAWIVVWVLASVSTWRCPSCRRSLGRWLYPKRCHRCGVELR